MPKCAPAVSRAKDRLRPAQSSTSFHPLAICVQAGLRSWAEEVAWCPCSAASLNGLGLAKAFAAPSLQWHSGEACAFQGSGCWIQFCSAPSFGRAASWGRAFVCRAVWLAFIFLRKQQCFVGLSGNISLTVSSTYSSFCLEERMKWRSNLAWKWETGQAACKPGLWKREQKSNYLRKLGYSLVQISTADLKNRNQPFCSSAERFAKGALSPLKKHFWSGRKPHFHLFSLQSETTFLCSDIWDPYLKKTLVPEIGRKMLRFIKVSRCISGCQNFQVTELSHWPSTFLSEFYWCYSTAFRIRLVILTQAVAVESRKN